MSIHSSAFCSLSRNNWQKIISRSFIWISNYKMTVLPFWIWVAVLLFELGSTSSPPCPEKQRRDQFCNTIGDCPHAGPNLDGKTAGGARLLSCVSYDWIMVSNCITNHNIFHATLGFDTFKVDQRLFWPLQPRWKMWPGNGWCQAMRPKVLCKHFIKMWHKV